MQVSICGCTVHVNLAGSKLPTQNSPKTDVSTTQSKDSSQIAFSVREQ